MITGIDYILYTDKSKDAFIEKIKESITFWKNLYIPLIMKMKQRIFLFLEMRKCFG